MPPTGRPDTPAVKVQLGRLLVSGTFKTSPRLRDFLKLTVSLAMEGRESEISQFLIATTVFKRPPDHFDPQINPIVRVEAARLRSKLREYYETEGQTDAVFIRYPKGTYVPSFESRASGDKPREPQARPAAPHNVSTALRSTSGRIFRVAVLPFLNLGPRKSPTYLGEAVAAQVINKLANVSCVRVVSQTSSFQFVSEERDIRQIAKDLGVDIVIDGAVRSAGREVRVTSQVNDAETGYLIWSKVFDWLKKDTLAMQEEVARVVAVVIEALCPPEFELLPGRGPAGLVLDAAPQL